MIVKCTIRVLFLLSAILCVSENLAHAQIVFPDTSGYGGYYITSKLSLLSLGGNREFAAEQQLWEDQQWTIRLARAGSNYYLLSTRDFDRYLIASDKIEQRPAIVVRPSGTLGVEALWLIKGNKDRSYTIVSVQNQLCLGIYGSGLKPGAFAQLQQCDDSDSQKWWIEPANSFYGSVFTGIDQEDFPLVEAKEASGAWTWGASVQMLLSYYGANQTQESIIERTFGTSANLPDLPEVFADDTRWGSFVSLTTQLDDWNIGTRSMPKLIKAAVSPGPLTIEGVMNRLNKGRPILVALHYGRNRGYVVIGANYGRTINALMVADPLIGTRVYPVGAFLNSVSAYWDITVSDSSPTKPLETSLSGRLAQVRWNFQEDIKYISSRTTTLPDRSVKKVYSVEALKEAVVSCKQLLMKELDQSEFVGMKAYVERFFPSDVGKAKDGANLESIRGDGRSSKRAFAHAVQQSEIGEAEFNGVVQKVEAFLSKLIANKRAVNLEVMSTPEGASFVLSAQGGASRSNDTNARVTNLFRGLYQFTLSKEGFRSVTREMNLVDESGTTIICKIYQTQAGSCLFK